MGKVGTIGKGVLALAVGALGVLGAMKVADARYVDDIWNTLGQEPSGTEVFSEKMVEDLPDPARRYFLHAIKPGTPLATKLQWRWSGEMKPGKTMPWMALTSEQITVKGRGLVRKIRASNGPLMLTAADHLLDGDGRMRISLYGLVPFINETGPDLSLSALGGMLAEGVFIPSSLLPGPHVQIQGVDDSRFTVTLEMQGKQASYTIAVDAEGRPTEQSVLQRWGNITDDGSYRFIPYGAVVEEEGTFGGYTIPTRVRGGWWYGTDRYLEVLHLKVDDVRYE